MRKLIDINSFKRENREKFNLLHASASESQIKNFYINYSKTVLKWLGILAILFLLLWGLSALPLNFFNGKQFFSKISMDKMQMVFLSNNQIYFGRIMEINKDKITSQILDYRYLKRNFEKGHFPRYQVWQSFFTYLIDKSGKDTIKKFILAFSKNPTKKTYQRYFKEVFGSNDMVIFNEYLMFKFLNFIIGHFKD